GTLTLGPGVRKAKSRSPACRSVDPQVGRPDQNARVRPHPPRTARPGGRGGPALGAGGVAVGEDADADEFRGPTVEGVGAHEAADLLVAGADAFDQTGEPGLPIVTERGEPHEPIEAAVAGGDERADRLDSAGDALEPVLPPPSGLADSAAVLARVVFARAALARAALVRGDPPFDDDLVPRLGHRAEGPVGIAQAPPVEAGVHQL